MNSQARYEDKLANPLKIFSRPRFRLTISVKVGGLALILLLGLITVAAFSYYQMVQIGNDIDLIARKDISITNHNSTIQRLSFDRQKLADSLSVYFTQNRNDQIVQAASQSRDKSEAINFELAAIKLFITTSPSSNEVLTRYADLERLLVELEVRNQLVITSTEDYAANLAADQRVEAVSELSDLTDLMNGIELTLAEVGEEVRRLTEDSATNARSRQETATTAIIVVALVALFLGASISVLLVRGLTRSIRDVSIRARDIESTVGTDNFVHHEIPVSSSDEVAELAMAFNEMSSSLERNIEERRRYATELADARDEAMEANQAKSKFLATISHELRTPLNAIIGYSEMLQEEAEEKNQTEIVPDLERINVAGRHLLTLINGVLDLSKIEAGQMDVFVEEFELAHEIGEVVSVVSPLVAKNSNDFVQEIPDDLGTMFADSTKIRQAIINLIGNAAKFTSDGTVTLTASRYDKDGEDWVRFAVKDTGIGMTEDQLDHIFQEFTQADSSISRRFEGTGLGLTVSRGFCQLMGGDISVESVFGKGSTFTIDMPINTEKYVPAEMLSSR